jgi:hypothetical protein
MEAYDHGGNASLYAQAGRHFAPSDSRLLTNLIKAERTYINHLRSSVSAAHAASAALSAWGTSEAPDVADASAHLGNLLAASAEVQSTHVSAIEGYRAALKDVADREASIRTVVRDRDILVGRLVKASQKSASSSSKKTPEERADKVAKAQRELLACEEVLLTEEAALVGVKRRTFKEALTMRMKTMGDAGAAMVDAAKEAILLLNDFDSSAHAFPAYGNGMPDQSLYDQQHTYDNQQTYDQQHAYDQHQAYDQQQAYGQYQAYDQQQMYEQQQQPYEHPYAQQQSAGDDQHVAYDHSNVNHPNFEISSVTPSQSASQIYQPHSNRDSMPYNVQPEAPAKHAQHHAPAAHTAEEDSDEEDWKRSFGQTADSKVVARQGGMHYANVPAPHQLDHRAGAESDFMPQAAPQNANVADDSHAEAPPQLPPKNLGGTRLTKSLSTTRSLSTKKSRASKASARQSEHNEPARPLNYVPMPPVPTAPRLDANGINMGPIPTAPKLYTPGGNNRRDSSSEDEDDNGRVTAHRGGASDWNMRDDQRRADQSSDDGTARAPSRATDSRKSGFFGKMGKLFKGDDRGAQPKEAESQPRERKTSMQWNTRIDSNVRRSKIMNIKDPASIGRKTKAFTAPLVADRPDSSDEERIDERDLVRHVNKGPPLWQSQGQSSSDIGTGRSLLSRPSMIKRMSSASVTAGPMSWKAQQEAQLGSGAGQVAAGSAHGETAPSSGTIKRKKKKAEGKPAGSIDGGSEIGTQSTRIRPAASISNPRHSVVVPGDASSGIRRSDSLNYGSMREKKGSLGKQSSKRLSAMSTQQVHGYGTKKGGVTPGDPSGKFATSNWVAKSNVADEPDSSEPKLAAPVATRPASQPAANTHKQPRAPKEEAPKHTPQPSRTMSPPLKPAIKMSSTDMSRTGSSLSNAANNAIPVLPPPVSAPPPASTLLGTGAKDFMSAGDKKQSEKPLGGDSSFDGTGKLDMPMYESETAPAAEKRVEAIKRTALPKIDMPPSEPFNVTLDDDKKKPSTPQNELSAPHHDSSPLMTPNERLAYNQFISEGANESKTTSADATTTPSLPGVTRTTVARATVGNGVLGPKNVPPPTMTAASERSRDVQSPSVDDHATLQRPGQLSRSYSGEVYASCDSSEDEAPADTKQAAESKTESAVMSNPIVQAVLHSATKKPASILSNSHLHAPAGDGAEKSPEGSTVSRRKSVRMAPDVKFPPETPPGDGSAAPSFGAPASSAQHKTGRTGSSTSQPATYTSQLSSRIAPPPPAPGRITVAPMDKPIDLGASRERSSWSTRISSTYADDSSDEDGDGVGVDSYASARRNFSSISRNWGKAVGQKSGGDAGSQDADTGKSKTGKKKKKKADSNSGYNPAIPLPSGMQVVGRSASKKGR